MKHKLDIAIHSINEYFNEQLYGMSIEEDLSILLDMSIEELKNHLYHFDNMGYIIYTYCLNGVPIQHIQNDLNKFISYYVIGNLKKEILPDYIIKSMAKKSYLIISKYRDISEELFDLIIQYVNTKIKNLIETLEKDEFEEYESCVNLQKTIKEMYEIIKKPTE